MLKDTIVYGIGNALTRFCGLMLFPIYAKILSPSEYASQDLALTLATLVTLVAGLGLDQGYARLFFERDTEDGRRDLATTWGLVALYVGVPLLVLPILVREAVANAVGITIDSAGLLLTWVFVGAALQLALRQPMLTIRLRKQPARFVTVSLVTALGQLVLGLWLVYFQKLGAVGVGMAYAGGSGAGLVCALFASGWIWRGRWSIVSFREMLSFGLPLLPAGAAAWALEALNRYLLQYYSGPLETAVLGVSTRIASILGLLFFSFQMSWAPYAFEAMRKPEEAARLYASSARWLWWVGGAGVIGISLLGPELLLLLSRAEYHGGSRVVPWVGMGYLVWTFFAVVTVGFKFGKKTYHQLIALLGGLAVVIGLAPFVAPRAGATGVAVVSFAAFWLACFLAARASAKYLAVPYPWARILLWQLLIGVVSVAAPEVLPVAEQFDFPSLGCIGIKICITGFATGIGMWIILDQGDQALIMSQLKRAWRKCTAS